MKEKPSKEESQDQLRFLLSNFEHKYIIGKAKVPQGFNNLESNKP